jgi:hypothetical protein
MDTRCDLGLTYVSNEIAGAPEFPAPGLHLFCLFNTSFLARAQLSATGSRSAAIALFHRLDDRAKPLAARRKPVS